MHGQLSHLRISIIILLALCTGSICAPSENAKKTIAVLPFSHSGLDESSSLVITDAFSDELQRSGKVRLLERSQINEILQEQNFSQSGACDYSECAVQIGKLLSVDKLILGSIGKIGDSWILTSRAVDISTGEVVGSFREQDQCALSDVTIRLVPIVASNIAKSLNGENVDIKQIVPQRTEKPTYNINQQHQEYLPKNPQAPEKSKWVRKLGYITMAVGFGVGLIGHMDYDQKSDSANATKASGIFSDAKYSKYKKFASDAKNGGNRAKFGYSLSVIGLMIAGFTYAF